VTLPKNILVPTDLSANGNAALDYAAPLAAKLDAKVHLFHAVDLPLFAAEMGFGMQQTMVDDLLASHERDLAQLAATYAKVCAFGPNHLEIGDPRAQIERLAVAVHADLIVMGTHGRRGLTRALLGSVTDAIVRVAPCPVLLVRAAA
jgi:nucleotide-binding universal stress UspA family protein